MADDCFDIDAWLARIGYDGAREPTLATLQGIVAAHSATIPFENIEVLLGQAPKLDIPSLQQKLMAGARGGYCFEQNKLLRAGLRALGFTVINRVARVIRSLPVETDSPAAHMMLQVNLPVGPYLADVGFGGLTPTAPLLWHPDIEQPTPHETMRLVRLGNDMVLEAQIGDSWEHLYRIMSYPVPDIDYEVANWMTGTHPGSPFVGNLVVARPGPDGTRHTFYNGRLTVRGPGGVERRILESAAEYRAVMTENFGLSLSDEVISAMMDALDRAGTRGTTSPFFS